MSREMFDADAGDFESREAGDKSVYVKFYYRPVQDEDASAKEGRPIYKDREYVEIRTPGNQTSVVQRPVSDLDRQRFRGAYRQFKNNVEEQVVGTPIAEATFLTRSQIEELSHMRIRTVEHLAELGDDVCSRFAGLYGLKNKAKAFVDSAKGQAPFIEMQKRNEELNNKIEAMQKTIEDQSEIIRKMQAQTDAKG